MPTYHYICGCGNSFEVVESIKSPRQKHCSLCGKDTLETVMYGGIHASVDPGCTTLGHLAEKNSKKMGKYQLSEIAEKNPKPDGTVHYTNKETRKKISKMNKKQIERYIIEGK